MSGTSFVTCPQCNCNRAIFECGRRSEGIYCRICGYEDGTILLSSSSRGEAEAKGWTYVCENQDDEIVFERKSSGHGVLRHSSHEGGGQTMSATSPFSDETASEVIDYIMNNSELDAERCYLTRWNLEKEHVDVLFGSICNSDCFLAEDECDSCTCHARNCKTKGETI